MDGNSQATEAAPRPSLVDDYVPGQVVADKYTLVRRLGEGGMASVWLAHNEPLDIDVAIKFIRADIEHRQLGQRLLQEARAAARLGHPGIVRVTDFGSTERGDPFIVMELLTGEDLGAALKERGRLSAVKAVRTILPVAHALSAAHDRGIVHRDLKPENIFLAQTHDGGVQPKLFDFGIAKLDKQGFERLTNFGSAMGSPAYMSPEQARGVDVDHRADIWALSVVIYEVITGRMPFDGKSYNALLRSIVEDAPAPITSFAAGDSELWKILEKGLAKDLDERYQTMRELGTALAYWLAGHGIAEDIAGGSLAAAWLQWRPSRGPSLPPPSATGRQLVVRTTEPSGDHYRPAPGTPLPVFGADPVVVPKRRSPLGWIALGVVVLGGVVAGVIFVPRLMHGRSVAPVAATSNPIAATETAAPAASPAAPPKAETAEPPASEAPPAATETAAASAAPAATASAGKPAAKKKVYHAKPSEEPKLQIKTTF